MLAGRYELDHEIGRGDCGAVWLGHDTVLARDVALKQIGITPGSGAPDLKRAEREAHLTARVHHDHVVAVFDVIDDGDQQWLVMEYVDGLSLDDMIATTGRLDPDQLQPLAAQIAGGLAAAHQHGIVHRDVNPSNILLSYDGIAKLSGFGVARAQTDASLTRTGLLLGTPAYLSPEVAAGQAATPASDVWSLGATLFHAASGRPPYEVGEDVMAAIHRIVSEEPPRLDDAGPIGALVTAMMQSDPAARPTALEIEQTLTADGPQHGTDDTAIVTAAPSPPPASTARPAPRRAAPRPARGRPLWLAAGAAAAALILLGLALAAGRDDTDDAPPRASATTEQPSASPSPAPTTATTPTGPTAEMLEGFVGDYLTAASNDPTAGFDMLTSEFQEQSGGLEGYEGFWGRVSAVDVRTVTGDPDTLTVSYTYRYELDGDRRTDDVTLQLVETDDGFLISGES